MSNDACKWILLLKIRTTYAWFRLRVAYNLMVELKQLRTYRFERLWSGKLATYVSWHKCLTDTPSALFLVLTHELRASNSSIFVAEGPRSNFRVKWSKSCYFSDYARRGCENAFFPHVPCKGETSWESGLTQPKSNATEKQVLRIEVCFNERTCPELITNCISRSRHGANFKGTNVQAVTRRSQVLLIPTTLSLYNLSSREFLQF